MMIKDSLEDVVKRENIYMLFDAESQFSFEELHIVTLKKV